MSGQWKAGLVLCGVLAAELGCSSVSAANFHATDRCIACGSERSRWGFVSVEEWDAGNYQVREMQDSVKLSPLLEALSLGGGHVHEWVVLGIDVEGGRAYEAFPQWYSNELVRNLEFSSEVRERLREQLQAGSVGALDVERALQYNSVRVLKERICYERMLEQLHLEVAPDGIRLALEDL